MAIEAHEYDEQFFLRLLNSTYEGRPRIGTRD
jgi:hypothetical protein